jgi:rfaE bifunctional protein kinase chain/domain
MKKEQIQKLLNDISSVRIAVVGDFCLDAYWFIDESESEISIETGLATRTVRQQKYSLGGAGNVTNNLAAMGVKNIRAFGVVGADPFAGEMISLMQKVNINTDNILVQCENWSTHVYTKPYIGDDEQNRIDFGNFNELSEETADRLIQNLKNEIQDTDLIIINEQVLSGIHTPYFRKKIVELIQLFPGKIFISDSRHYSGEYEGAYRKMNDVEAVLLCDPQKQPEGTIPYAETCKAAKTLFKRYKKPLFVTCGSRGSLIVNENGVTDIWGIMIMTRVDTVGAGDSYLAGVAAALAAGYDMETAARTGTMVAGVTVQKLFQTGTATPEEIMQTGQDPDYIFSPELAENIRQAKYAENSEIEIVNPWTGNLQIEHAIFDHDGTISTLREGWELIMEPMMVKAVLGKKYQEADDVLYRKVQARVHDYIDKTTGIQTLVQMKGLLDIIREFGCVPEEEMLDEFGYKKIYNDELLEMVKVREKKYRKGELSLEDFTMKNAVPFLQKLYDAGVKLYLASGTDEEDVKKEAEALGYAHLFEGRIYGSVGDITKEAKKIVLDRILSSIGESSFGKLITFGDGPVEMRETRKRGGLSVGIASDELKRFGLNKSKRTRLIKAGADVIIADFSQINQLLELLGIDKQN